MRISASKRFILLHVPRTGVSSIIAALDEDLFVRAAPTRRNRFMSKYLPIVRRPLGQTYFRPHETAAHVRRLLSPGDFEKYHRIAFVRNPYSWLVSLYEIVLQSPGHRHHARVRGMSGFSDYVDWEIGRGKRRQHPYLLDPQGRWLVDHVGRFERLAEDAASIFAAIGVELEPLPRAGQFTRRDYREFYDAPTRRKVAVHWARDLELLGYDFEGPGPDSGALPG